MLRAWADLGNRFLGQNTRGGRGREMERGERETPGDLHMVHLSSHQKTDQHKHVGKLPEST